MGYKTWVKVAVFLIVTLPATLFIYFVTELRNTFVFPFWGLFVLFCCGGIIYYNRHPEKSDSYKDFLDVTGLVVAMFYAAIMFGMIFYPFA